ncbi:MAG: endopeptidase La [Proteobacteria bacterium]|nr:endopeptidase La [Pseudomonadota bacterium]NIS69092.1 endopeptidase La [Pseudomonadota bacterium]
MSQKNKANAFPVPKRLPLIPLQGSVLFPHTILPLFFHSDNIVKLLEAVSPHFVGGFFSQKKENTLNPDISDLHSVGVAGRILQVVKLPEGGVNVLVEGISRIVMGKHVSEEPPMLAHVEEITDEEEKSIISDTLVQSARSLFKLYLSRETALPRETDGVLKRLESPGRLADLIATHLDVSLIEKQEILECVDPLERLKRVLLLLSGKIQAFETRPSLSPETTRNSAKAKKGHMVWQQTKSIQKQLGEDDPHAAEISELRERARSAEMPKKVEEVAEREISRLERMNPTSAEYTVSRTYVDYLVTLPWNRSTKDNLDINRAESILNEDHYDLEKVKDRILEYLAVKKMRKAMKGPILCFVGPPGVGKTSLGKSIARALGRRFIRISLGGMRDEAEIRGHRRTYVGALPGRIIQEIRRSGIRNPVFMLDEVDKIGQDFRGDPAAALLEVLDPEQNSSFTDHYLDVPFDLSSVMFVTTANSISPIPPALRDRMEVIHIPGYTDEEKESIATAFLIPHQIEENGLRTNPIVFQPEAIQKIIQEYTQEAGVRNFEREIAAICRKVTRELTQGKEQRRIINSRTVEEFLGPQRVFREVKEERDDIGVAMGLAWTENGGDIMFVEVSRLRGEKGLILTGSLGDVMKESVQAALSYIRSHARDHGISQSLFSNHGFHVHFPAGAIPKEGPSAGATIAVALFSLLAERPVRHDVAITGELTLTGKILPVGGVKEKIHAALRADVRKIILPRKNKAHLEDITNDVLTSIEIVFVNHISDVFREALIQ